MSFAFSPSNLGTFKLCPRRFQGQSVTKEIKWQSTTQKSRGTLVHQCCEQAVKNGYDSVRKWPDQIDIDFLKGRISIIRQLMSMGAMAFTERDMAVNSSWSPVDFWDENAYLRCRADLIVVTPEENNPIILGDWKTGRKWDSDDFQLRCECLLAHYVFARPIVQYSYYYVDSGETSSGLIDFRNGMEPVQDILDLLRDATTAMMSNNFPAQKNKFCKWCAFNGTADCGL